MWWSLFDSLANWLNKDMFSARCLCGKLCTSSPGLTLHQKRCVVAQQASKSGKKSTFDSGVLGPAIKYVDDVQKIVDLVESLARDAHQALTNHNRSAGRRARTLLLEVRGKITPLRKKILNVIKE